MLCYHLSDLECGHQLSPPAISALLSAQSDQQNKQIFLSSPLSSSLQSPDLTVVLVDIFTLLSPWRVIILNTMAPFNLVTFLPSLLCDAATDCALPQL